MAPAKSFCKAQPFKLCKKLRLPACATLDPASYNNTRKTTSLLLMLDKKMLKLGRFHSMYETECGETLCTANCSSKARRVLCGYCPAPRAVSPPRIRISSNRLTLSQTNAVITITMAFAPISTRLGQFVMLSDERRIA